MNLVQKHFDNLRKAIEAERVNEESYYQKLQSSKSLSQRIESGVLWSPALITKVHYTLGELIEVHFEQVKHFNNAHKFRAGAGVRVYENKTDEYKFESTGTISYLRNRKMRVILSRQDITRSQILHCKYLNIELRYDERPYQVMKDAVSQVMASSEPFIKDLRNTIVKNNFEEFGSMPFEIKETPVFKLLNHSQKEAIKQALQKEGVFVIHGPPGTGKTTSLTGLIEQLAINKNKILVCAPSNNAADLLAQKADQIGLETVRLGNISRISDSLGHLTLAEKARNHKDWQHIKKVRIEAEEAKRVAEKYKRNFGREERAERKMMRQESRALRDWANELEQRLVDEILDSCQVFVSTLVSAANKSLTDRLFDVAIIDEASQALEPECYVPILKSKKVILAGDHFQLPPTISSKEAKALGLETTLLDRLSTNPSVSALLAVQYRMDPKILAFSNAQFYQDRLRTDDSVLQRKNHIGTNPIKFIDTAGTGFEEAMNKQHRSYFNEGEFFIIREYLLQAKERLEGRSIGIISPYSEQVRFIQRSVKDSPELSSLQLEINSIDGFQGQERDLIIISLVRSNDIGNIGFLMDQRRLNVAMTRAKYQLIIIGDSATICQHRLFDELYQHIEKEGEIQSAWMYMNY